MKVGPLFLADIGRDINPVIKVADYTEAELQNELEDYVVTDIIEKGLLDFLDHYSATIFTPWAEIRVVVDFRHLLA